MSVTVFETHGDPTEATHAVTCTNTRCRRKGRTILAPPLPGHVSGKRKRREVIYCGHCGERITWAEVRALPPAEV